MADINHGERVRGMTCNKGPQPEMKRGLWLHGMHLNHLATGCPLFPMCTYCRVRILKMLASGVKIKKKNPKTLLSYFSLLMFLSGVKLSRIL